MSDRPKAKLIMDALYRGQADAQLLGGRDFNPAYWRNARRQLSNLVRELDRAEGERDALRAVIGDSP